MLYGYEVKKHSQDNIWLKYGLKWGSSTSKLLGITFCVDLTRMLNLNYAPWIQETENIIHKWLKQSLKTFGKITIIKSLIVSELNQLFLPIQMKIYYDNSIVKYMLSFVMVNRTRSIGSFHVRNTAEVVKKILIW